MSEIAVGATVFDRRNKIESLLDSIGSELPINTVYIADNGCIDEQKTQIYGKEYPFDIEVLDLEYDSGLGHSRREIVNRSNEEYLLIVDNDVEIPYNVTELHTILENRTDLGGVGGVLIETSRIRSDCHDLFNRGSILIKDIREAKTVQEVAGSPLIEFDQIQNVTLYRRECLEDYCWDPKYKIGWEHTDFFIGHKKQTQWSFAVCPEVMFHHNPGGDTSYISKRKSKDRLQESKEYFLEKWGYEQVLNGQVNWLQTNSGLPTKQRLIEQFIKHFILSLPPNLQLSVLDLRDYFRKLQGKPPV